MCMKDTSPSGNLEPPTFYVGRNATGRWIAQDADHLRGGLFISRAAAMKFAMDETGHRADAIVTLDRFIELDFGIQAQRHATAQSLPRAA
jgi:hypothetical protein